MTKNKKTKIVLKFSRIYCFRNNGAIVIRSIMIKQVIIAIILTSLLVGNSWDAEARERAVRQEKFITYEQSETKVREKRFINPFTSLFSVWNALTHIYSLYAEVSHFYIAHNYLNLMNVCWLFCSKKMKHRVQSSKRMISSLTVSTTLIWPQNDLR